MGAIVGKYTGPEQELVALPAMSTCEAPYAMQLDAMEHVEN